MFIKFGNKRASFDNGNLSVGYSQATLPEDPVVIDPPVIEPLDFPTNDFNDIGAVYNALYPEDKLILILRHGHRTEDTRVLTTLGEAQCRFVGSKLKEGFAAINESKYVSSNTTRTKKTCYNIMLGREDDLYDDFQDIPADYMYNPVTEGLLSLQNKDYNLLGGDDFRELPGYTDTISNENSWDKISNYSFGLHQNVDAQTLLARKNEKDALSNIILNKLIAVSDKKVNIYASHDDKLTLMLSTFTDVQYDFQAKESGYDISEGKTKNGKWINYLSGLACVIHINGVKEYIPVRGLSVGYTYGYPTITNNDNYTGPAGNFEWTPFLP